MLRKVVGSDGDGGKKKTVRDVAIENEDDEASDAVWQGY